MDNKKRLDTLSTNYHMLKFCEKRKIEAIEDGDDVLKNQMTKDIKKVKIKIRKLGGDL